MKDAPTPLTIIAGFLGSGKTCLLNHLLAEAEGRRITALVNDFGALNIDSELIAAQHGNQISLANGCVCCSIGDDLTLALAETMNQTPRPDHIIIEASGVADPSRIAAFAAIDRDLRLDGIVTLVDAPAHSTHATDPHLADIYSRQIAAADLLLINKIDLAEATTLDELGKQLAKARPQTPQIKVQYGAAAPDIVLGPMAIMAMAKHTSTLPDHGLVSWAAHLPAYQNRAALMQKIGALRPHALRAKGIFEDNQGTYNVHLAGGNLACHPFDAKASGHFVIIGKLDMPDATTLAKHFEQESDA